MTDVELKSYLFADRLEQAELEQVTTQRTVAREVKPGYGSNIQSSTGFEPSRGARITRRATSRPFAIVFAQSLSMVRKPKSPNLPASRITKYLGACAHPSEALTSR
jgi:hypothetical protein